MAAAALLAAMAITGCGTSGGSGESDGSGGQPTTTAEAGVPGTSASPTAPCDVLDQEVPLASDVGAIMNGPGGTHARDLLPWLLRSFDDQQSTVIVYLEPGTPETRLDQLAEDASHRPGVVSIETVGVGATYADFQDLFEDQEQMLDNVRPEDLPTSVRVEIEAESAEDLADWARSQHDLFEVRDASDVQPSVLDGLITKQGDRDGWSTLAERLDTVDGAPEWAATGSTTIRALLEDGPTAPVDDPEALTEARAALDEVLQECAPG